MRLFSSYCLLFLFIMGCATADDDVAVSPGVSIDPAFQEFYDSFLVEATARGHTNLDRPVYLHFADLNSTNVDTTEILNGLCNVIGGDSVFIDRDQWTTLDLVAKERLVYHELGHCLLNRPHVGDAFLLDASVARSIMIPSFGLSSGFLDFSALAWRKYYIDELFGINNDLPDDAIGYAEYRVTTDTILTLETNTLTQFDTLIDLATPPFPTEVALHSKSYDDNVTLSVNGYVFRYYVEGPYISFTLHSPDRFLGGVTYYFYSNSVWADEEINISYRFIDNTIHLYLDEYLLFFKELTNPHQIDISLTAPAGLDSTSLWIGKLE